MKGDLKNRVWKQSKGRPEEWKEEKTLELRHRDKNETNNERKRSRNEGSEEQSMETKQTQNNVSKKGQCNGEIEN